ncbi:hypothetical protein [Oscillatoria sp. FACHB-1406]|uniref:hypothetical protein n=1 Tax=Oscillatoria sp. FACHB-1406 TaxID=2692846 RepID=UPI0016830BCE|nr:hypothetical protein [Oscillatoria sp. FACHB-1406]MBD2578603.1 hypothetical protein [Oscillatoria sp. FACHB-1406]
MIELKESLRQQLEGLNEEQLKQVANFIAFLEFVSHPKPTNVSFRQTLTPERRARQWQESVKWAGTLGVNLPEIALHRDTMYDE